MGDQTDDAFVEDCHGHRLPVIADVADIDNVPLAVFNLDQGPPGLATAAFICGALFLIEFVWDSIHRVIRDIKGALPSAAGGIFLKAQIYSSHVWSLNMKPFGSKTCGVMKRRILSSFLLLENYEGERFNKVTRIRIRGHRTVRT